MLSALELALALGAFVAGMTGTWSPCGFSMVETIGPTGHSGGLRATLAACMTFALGALAGGVATFVSLSTAGLALDAGGAAEVVAGAIAIAAALGEARGTRILPQVRRQLPEHWRRVLPMPLAAAGYGVLLGLGFTTFVLTFAVWALAGASVALADPAAGLVVGLAFGAGRALPVVALAPFAGSEPGYRVTEVMAERIGVYRGFRVANAVALAICAALLLPAGAAARSTVAAAPATDPSATDDALAWQQPGGPGLLRTATGQTALPGDSPAVGGGLVAWRSGSSVTIARRADLGPIAQLDVPGVNELAVSDGWLLYRTSRVGGGDRLAARPITDLARVRGLGIARGTTELGRPSVSGHRAVFHVAGRRGSRIVQVDLQSGRRRTLRRERHRQLLNPALLGQSVLYVVQSRCGQELRLARGRGERRLLRLPPPIERDEGHEPGRTTQGRRPGWCGGSSGTTTRLWTTALTRSAAYVTRLRPSGADVLRVDR
jgi:hypothetical protein